MSELIRNILAGEIPEDIKAALDHCEEIAADCNVTLIDPEVAEHDKKNYRELRHMARSASQKLLKMKKA